MKWFVLILAQVGLVRIIERERSQMKVFVLEWHERTVNGLAAVELCGLNLYSDFTRALRMESF